MWPNRGLELGTRGISPMYPMQALIKPTCTGQYNSWFYDGDHGSNGFGLVSRVRFIESRPKPEQYPVLPMAKLGMA